MDWSKLIASVGVPSAILFYVLIRVESAVKSLAEVVIINNEKLNTILTLMTR